MIGKIAMCLAACLIGQAVSFPTNNPINNNKMPENIEKLISKSSHYKFINTDGKDLGHGELPPIIPRDSEEHKMLVQLFVDMLNKNLLPSIHTSSKRNVSFPTINPFYDNKLSEDIEKLISESSSYPIIKLDVKDLGSENVLPKMKIIPRDSEEHKMFGELMELMLNPNKPLSNHTSSNHILSSFVDNMEKLIRAVNKKNSSETPLDINKFNNALTAIENHIMELNNPNNKLSNTMPEANISFLDNEFINALFEKDSNPINTSSEISVIKGISVPVDGQSRDALMKVMYAPPQLVNVENNSATFVTRMGSQITFEHPNTKLNKTNMNKEINPNKKLSDILSERNIPFLGNEFMEALFKKDGNPIKTSSGIGLIITDSTHDTRSAVPKGEIKKKNSQEGLESSTKKLPGTPSMNLNKSKEDDIIDSVVRSFLNKSNFKKFLEHKNVTQLAHEMFAEFAESSGKATEQFLSKTYPKDV